MALNNVNLERLTQAVEEAKADPTKAKRVTRVEGHWNVEEGKPQFTGVLKYESGQVTVEADQPTAMGGGGRLPGPLHYCMYGLAACYAATYASMAAMMGVSLRKLEVAAEGHFNFSRVFGLSDAPALEEVRITLTVDAEADQAKLDELEELARQRCPAVYTLSHQVPLVAEVKRG
jgi:uncharacterized OsmC-like protein